MVNALSNGVQAYAPPNSSDELTPEWLTYALRQGGIIDVARVLSIDARPIGNGMAGTVIQVALRYDTQITTAPSSVIVKLQSSSGSTLEMARRLSIYEREARFYTEIAGAFPAPVPRLYYCSPSAPGCYALVLEDLSPASEGSLLLGCSLEQAATVVGWIGDAHAAWWQSPKLDALNWLPAPNYAAASDVAAESTGKSWKIFRRKLGPHAPRHVIALGERLDGSTRVIDQLSAEPRTLVHGDLRLPNVMFAPDGAPVAIVDWQTAMRGRGAMDLAAFFLFSLSPPDRRRAEGELLPAYIRMLEDRGIGGYSLEQCWHDYRLAVIDQFSQIVLLSSLLDVDTKLDHHVANAVGARVFAAIEDLDLIELLAPPRTWWSALLKRLPA